MSLFPSSVVHLQSNLSFQGRDSMVSAARPVGATLCTKPEVHSAFHVQLAASTAVPPSHRQQPCPPHLSRISLHFGCISQTIAFSEASHYRPADVVICESRCMDSLQSNVILLTGCGGGMYNLIHLFPTSFMP